MGEFHVAVAFAFALPSPDRARALACAAVVHVHIGIALIPNGPVFPCFGVGDVGINFVAGGVDEDAAADAIFIWEHEGDG